MDKQQSTLLKGIAILMMLWYHLFYREEVTELCTPLLFIGDELVARMVARACYPVSFFLIFSGYGLSFLYQQGRLTVKNQLQRLLRLYIHYWVVLLIFVTIGYFVNPERYIIDPIHLADNITGLHCTYNGETWFLLPYAIICLLAVGLMPWLFRINSWLKTILLVIGYAICFGAMKLFMAKYGEPLDGTRTLIFILQIVYVIVNFFYFALGVLLFRLINERHLLSIHHRPINHVTVIVLLLLLIVVKSQFKVTLADGLYAFFFIVLFLQLPFGRRMTKVLKEIGRHSMPMWMTHTFFAVYLFPDFFYAFRYPVLIFLALVTVSYLVSFPILWLSKRIINSFYSIHKMMRIIISLLAIIFSLSISAQEYTETGIPVCYIVTKDSLPIVSKTEFIDATLWIMHRSDTLLKEKPVQIKGRGNTTWSDPKKPYKLKFYEKTEVLGMNSNKSWVLLSNYTDKSLMRTAIGFRLGELLETAWTPKSQFVELVLNGEHLGNYQLVESIKEGKKRINIESTGFILELNVPYREHPYNFTTDTYKWRMAFKYPDEEDMTRETYDYARQVMNLFEESLTMIPNQRFYTELIEENSFVKWYYQKNLLMMEECNRYYVKRDNTSQTRLEMGPLWDFEWCLGVGLYYDENRPNPKHHLENKVYFGILGTDHVFMSKVAELHFKKRDEIQQNILDYYNELSEKLAVSAHLNFQRWPILDQQVRLGAFPLGSWEAEVNCDRQFFLNHLNWLDGILKRYVTSSIDDICPLLGKSDVVYNLKGQRVNGERLASGIFINNRKTKVVK